MPVREAATESRHFLTTDLFVLSALAIALFKLVYWFSASGNFIPESSYSSFIEVLAQSIAMILLVVIEHYFSYTMRQASMVLVSAALLQALGSYLFFTATQGDTQIAITAALLLRGAGSAAFLLEFGRLLCSIEPAKSALIILGGQALYGILSLVFAPAAVGAIMFFSTVLPLASAFCLLWAQEKTPISIENPALVTFAQLRKIPIHPIILLALCTLSKIVTYLLSPASHTASQPFFHFFLPAIYLVAFLSCVAWVYGLKRKDPEILWPFLMLIIFAGLFVCSSFLFIAPDFAFNLVSATQKTVILFSWVFMASVIYRLKLPIIPIFCLGQLLFAQLPCVLGDVIKTNAPQTGTNQSMTLMVVTTTIMSLVVISAILVVVSNGKPKTVPSSYSVSSEAALRSAIKKLTEYYALSNREAEVALLIAKGYTLNAISEKLIISIDTVRTHAKNLYRKLDIHKKQDLLAMIEEQLSVKKRPVV